MSKGQIAVVGKTFTRITIIGNTRHFRTPTGKSRMLHNETDKAPKTWTFIGYFAVNEGTGKLGYYNPKYGNFDDQVFYND